MKLWLLRHGQAEGVAARDELRALTQIGQAEVLRAVQYLSTSPSQILVSPYLRAQQTAAIVHAALTHPPALLTVDWLVPETNPQQALDQLEQYQMPNLLLVAHQPLLGELAGLLLYGHRQQPLALPTAGLLELEADYWLAGSADLRGLHYP